MAAKGRAADTAQKNAAWLAWTIASLAVFAFHDPKKMPALETLTGEPRRQRVQTPEEMKASMAAWAARS